MGGQGERVVAVKVTVSESEMDRKPPEGCGQVTGPLHLPANDQATGCITKLGIEV